MSHSKASVALLRHVADVALRAVEDEHCYVATSPWSTPILAEHIAAVADPEAYSTSTTVLRAAVQLSQIVDYVQDGAPVFDWQRVAQPYLSQTYTAMRNNVKFARALLDGDALAEFERAEKLLYADPPQKTAAYAQYAELKSQVLGLRVEVVQLKAQLRTADDAAAQALHDRIAAIEAGLNAQEELLRALDEQHGFERALRVYNGAQLVAIPRSFEEAADMIGTSLMDIHDGFTTHLRALFSPSRLAEENWIPITVAKEDIDAAATDDPLVPPVGPDDQVARLDEDAVDRIDLEVQVLVVQRPWCWQALFGNRLWTWATPDEPVSTGGERPQGKIPAYTVALVVARRLRISGKKALVQTVSADAAPTWRIGNFRFAAPIAVPRGQLVNIVAHPGIADAITTMPAQPRVRPDLVRPHAPLRAIPRPARPSTVARPVVQGRIVDVTGQPVADATVRSTQVDTGQAMVKVSSRRGDVSFEVDGRARHDLEITRPGYLPYRQQLTFEPGGTFTVTLRGRFEVPTVLVAGTWRGGAAGRMRPEPLPRPLPLPRPDLPEPVPHPVLTVKVAKVMGDAEQAPMDAPLRIEVRDPQQRTQQVVTIDAGQDALLRMPPGPYEVSAHCEVYDAAGPARQTVDLRQDSTLTFLYRHRTILQNDEIFFMGFVCRRVPRSPDPHPDARW